MCRIHSILHLPEPQHIITVDASGLWGCGAVGLQATVLGNDHLGASACCHGYCLVGGTMAGNYSPSTVGHQDALLMQRLRCFHFFLGQFDIQLVARQLTGLENTAVYALS